MKFNFHGFGSNNDFIKPEITKILLLHGFGSIITLFIVNESKAIFVVVASLNNKRGDFAELAEHGLEFFLKFSGIDLNL